MKPVSPFPDGAQHSVVEEPATSRRSRVARYHTAAAWAFIWSPVLLIAMFYVGEVSHRLLPIVKPLFALVVFANPVVLVAAMIVLASSERRSRWVFFVLNAAVLLLEIVGCLMFVAGSSRTYL